VAGLNGGTITVDSTMSGTTLTQITTDAMNGTLDFSVNNPSMTIGTFSSSGSSTRTLKMGSGTFTITATNVQRWHINNRFFGNAKQC
jgi:hypothetical protein